MYTKNRLFSTASKLSHLTDAQLMWIALLISLPAFLIHLGAVAFIGDEAIRSLVAYEMNLSENYLVPTLNGEAYFNKPPLFNWFIILMSELFGFYGEWPTRMVTIFFLSLYAWTIFYFIRKHFDQLTAISMTFMMLTCGRILVWDSMLGLIDICFSFIVYLNFMVIYHYRQKERWLPLFILSYLLCSIAFLLKGIPAIVFQAISIVTALYLFGELKRKLFSKEHLIGILIGVIPILVYYFSYAYYVSLHTVIQVLIEQSMQRTATHHGLYKTFIHLFTFPFEQVYHFLPWSVLLVFIFHPKFLIWVNSQAFIRFNFWMMVLNLPVYWLSVEVYPRYLLMFVPMFNITMFYILQQTKLLNSWYWNRIHILFLIFLLIAANFILFFPLDSRIQYVDGVLWIWLASTILIIFAILGLLGDEQRMVLWFAIGILILRLTFSAVVLPIRAQTCSENKCRESCLAMRTKYIGNTWYIYDTTQIHQVARFYTTYFGSEIIRKTKDPEIKNGIYLVDLNLYPDFKGRIVDTLLLEKGEIIQLMKND
ncbi:MAG: hypothetical protein IPL31_02855 [Saprospiraceae bacterium]|nr:hypothetical protein [Saprospiraceae bacterium]